MTIVDHRELQTRFARMCRIAAFSAVLVATVPGTAHAQEAGISASVPVVDAGDISADGDLSEWEDLPLTVTVNGPQPSTDPGTRGRLRWQVASDPTTVYLAATVTDDAITVGDDPDRYWEDDSIEFYLNLSDDLTAADYGPGISQIRITPVDLGNSGSTVVTVNGNNSDEFGVTGVVFATDDGWGTEIAIDVSEFETPTVGDRFGIQIHLNGSSGDGRDIKVIWSTRDQDDSSFEDPSVFGQGVFVSDVEPPAEPIPADGTVEPDPVEEIVATPGPEVSELQSAESEIITSGEQQRSLLIAAVASSAAVLFGGLWFERKRRKDETRHQAERIS